MRRVVIGKGKRIKRGAFVLAILVSTAFTGIVARPAIAHASDYIGCSPALTDNFAPGYGCFEDDVSGYNQGERIGVQYFFCNTVNNSCFSDDTYYITGPSGTVRHAHYFATSGVRWYFYVIAHTSTDNLRSNNGYFTT